MTEETIEEFAELVMKRRTVRRFEEAPVEREVLEGIARLAQRTPSAGFSLGQRVVRVPETFIVRARRTRLRATAARALLRGATRGTSPSR